MALGIGRRQFTGALGSAAIVWPLVARAQQGTHLHRIGVLMNSDETNPEGQARAGAFREGLEKLGWTEGRNVRVEYSWTSGNAERERLLAKELVGLQPDVIVALGTLALRAVSQETRSLPIVFALVSDPVQTGLVASLAYPGGNITGFSQYEYTIGGKWLELLKEFAPGITRVAVIMNANNPASLQHLRTIESLAASLKVEAIPVRVRDDAELERGIAEFESSSDGLIGLPSIEDIVDRDRTTALAAQHRLPAIYAEEAFVRSGGLMSYGVDAVDPCRQAASYVDRILKGEKPADLPVQAPTKYELVVNLETAKALGLNIPPTLLSRADEVIE
jgi:putative ABC transport system substrate-binding protein